MPEAIKLQVGGYRYPAQTWLEGTHRFFSFGFNKLLQAEIKAMKGAKYHGYDEVNPRKLWSIEECVRNDFQISYLKGENPYAHYDAKLEPIIVPPRWNHSKQKMMSPFGHHGPMIAHMVHRRRCIVASEMGTAKTFGVIHALEIMSGDFKLKHGIEPTIWYMAPRSALRAVEREFLIWGCSLKPKFMTYEAMVKAAKNWQPGDKAPVMIVFDESSKLKNYTAQRSQAAQQFADGCRADWGEDSVVILMSGSPAPKSPSDWWSQAEIACPGFIREGDINKFNNRLGIIIQKENFQGGGTYPHLVSWRDSIAKCNKCGELRDHAVHAEVTELAGLDGGHPFEPSVNEIEKLYQRLKGLTVVFFKKDCLDLPDKTYRTIEMKPTASTVRAAKLIVKGAKTTIEGLIRLRELSDGFQYKETKVGMQTCQLCSGTCKSVQREEIPNSCPQCGPNGPYFERECLSHTPQYGPDVETKCPRCKNGEEPKYDRTTVEVPTPKEQVVIDLLDEYEDIGRVVIYAGFTAAIDRCVRICQKQGWMVIRVDQGKELIYSETGAMLGLEYLGIHDYIALFQDLKDKHPRVAFVAHPGSAGMGLTLTASPVIIYYSNDYNADNRIQSEDRIHRPGMDINLGATIIDLIHLPSDVKILANLKKKRDLQSMSLGELADSFKGEDHERPE